MVFSTLAKYLFSEYLYTIASVNGNQYISLYFSVPNSATEETSSQCPAQLTFEDVSMVSNDLLSNLVDVHEEDSNENDEEYWNTP